MVCPSHRSSCGGRAPRFGGAGSGDRHDLGIRAGKLGEARKPCLAEPWRRALGWGTAARSLNDMALARWVAEVRAGDAERRIPRYRNPLLPEQAYARSRRSSTESGRARASATKVSPLLPSASAWGRRIQTKRWRGDVEVVLGSGRGTDHALKGQTSQGHGSGPDDRFRACLYSRYLQGDPLMAVPSTRRPCHGRGMCRSGAEARNVRVLTQNHRTTS